MSAVGRPERESRSFGSRQLLDLRRGETPEIELAPAGSRAWPIQRSPDITSRGDCHRSSGSFSRQVFTSRSSAGGAIGDTSEIDFGSSRRIAETSEAWLEPENAFRPVAIS